MFVCKSHFVTCGVVSVEECARRQGLGNEKQYATLHADKSTGFFFFLLFNEFYQVLPIPLVPRLRFDVDGSPLFLPLINFITLSPTPLHLTKR